VPLGRVGYRSVGDLLAAEPLAAEYPATAALIGRLRHVRRSGEFSRAEFVEMARWKSPRAMPLYRRHRAARIRALSRKVLATRSEPRRMELLTELSGVSVPVASAILTLIDPRRYGVLDIRVWQLLWALGAVDRRPAGRGFTVADWLVYLAELRGHARGLGVSVRTVELTLFERHRRAQRGRLYDPVEGRARSVRPTAIRAGRRGRA
jgi:hypothetical protein